MLRISLSRAPALLALAVLLPAAAAAQSGRPGPLDSPQFGVGWVGNAPEALAGASAYVILPTAGGIGIYVDAKFDISNPTGELGYDASVTSRQVADQEQGARFLKTEGSWQSFNAALMRPLTDYLVGYVGGGIARVTRYDLWDVSADSPLGLSGVVWAENPDTEETRANLMFGVLMRMSGRLSAHFGYETQPSGVTVGFSLRIPRW